MNYGEKAAAISKKCSLLEETLSAVKEVSFDSVWKGDAHDNLTDSLSTTVKKIKTEKENALTLVKALEKLDQYKNNDSSIKSYKNSLAGLDSENDAQQITNINSKINSLNKENNSLKSSINSLINSITFVNSEFEAITYEDTTNYGDYIVDLGDFLSLFSTGALTKIPDNGGSLYDYYTEEEVDSMLANIKSQYSGRDAAVNCALGIMEMAADVGKKLDYDWGGGHSTITDVDDVATGVDCSAFASWAINQGSSETFTTRTTSSLINVGTRINYEDAQKGDILVYNTDGKGHVVMIVDNDPETQQFLVVEASGSNAGVVMQTRSYSSLSGTYQARDLSSIYND